MLEALRTGEALLNRDHWQYVASNVNPQQRRFGLPDYVSAIREGSTMDFRAQGDAEMPAAPITVVLDKSPRKRRRS